MQINNGYGNTTTNWNQASSIQRENNTSNHQRETVFRYIKMKVTAVKILGYL